MKKFLHTCAPQTAAISATPTTPATVSIMPPDSRGSQRGKHASAAMVALPGSALLRPLLRLGGVLALGGLLLAGCAGTKQPELAMYDLGPLPALGAPVAASAGKLVGPGPEGTASPGPGPTPVSDVQAGATSGQLRLPSLALADPNAPAWLDSPAMYYRLDYANALQPLPYAGSRWNMPPADLFAQRLKARLAHAGGAVISASDGALDVPVLHVETDEFMQRFSSPTQSSARVMLRVAVLKDRSLVAQKNFSAEAPAPSADAAGGVRALADASDQAIDQIIAWLAALPLRK